MTSRPRRSHAIRSGWLAVLLSLGGISVLDARTAAQDEAPDETAPGEEEEAVDPERVLALTLEDAVRIALQQNLDLEAEALATKIARFNAAGSWGSFDPVFSLDGTIRSQEIQGTSSLAGGAVVKDDSLSFTGALDFPLTTGGFVQLSYFHTNDETTNTFSLFDTSTRDVFTLTLTQPLLRGAWSRYATATQREQEILLERQRASEAGVRQTLIYEVISSYWELVSARQELEVRKLAVERAEKQQQQDERRLDLGAGTAVEVLQSKTTVAQQKERLINARFLLRSAEDTLRAKIFQKTGDRISQFLDEWDWPIEPLTELPSGTMDVEVDWRESLRRAIQDRPVIWQLRHDIDAAEVRLARSRSDRRPQLDLNLSTSSGGFDSDPDESLSTALGWDFPTNTATLSFSLPLRNRTASYAERAARASLRQARLALDQLELTLLADVRAAVRDLEYRAAALEAARTSERLAEDQLKAELTRMDIGMSTTFQVLEYQETLAEANSATVAARAAYAKAFVNIAAVEGRLGNDSASWLPAPSR